MKDKVYISIRGLQDASGVNPDTQNQDDKESIEIINVGTYRVVNDIEYIKYEELSEEGNDRCKSMIKIAENAVDITKKGNVSAHLSFQQGQKTMTFYETPYGNIYLGIFTRNMKIERTQDRVLIQIEYALELNYQEVSDCEVTIEITSQGEFSL